MTPSEQTLMSVAEAIGNELDNGHDEVRRAAVAATQAYQQSAEMRALVEAAVNVSEQYGQQWIIDDAMDAMDKALLPFTKESSCADT